MLVLFLHKQHKQLYSAHAPSMENMLQAYVMVELYMHATLVSLKIRVLPDHGTETRLRALICAYGVE